MTSATAAPDATPIETPANWGAVVALSLGAFALVAPEFVPISILTPIASDLAISEGEAGQALSVSGAFAVLTSLTLTTLTRALDRKPVLLALIALMVASGTAAPVGFWTWLARTLPDDAEAGGGLMVASIQLSITLGTTRGGLLYDAGGYGPAFGASVLLLLSGGTAFVAATRSGRAAPA